MKCWPSVNVSLALAIALTLRAQDVAADKNLRQEQERLAFQTSQPWTPRINLNADVVMAYGLGDWLLPNLASWRQHGYKTAVMTGVAWGHYQDYFDGSFDGQHHMDEIQMDAQGKPVIHGGRTPIPYMSPGDSYGRYLAKGIKRALAAGVDSVYLEEPEFFARSGWEENFKREWKTYYHEDWQPPNSSPDAQYRASKLKYFLYRRALGQVFDFAKEYGKANGRTIRCYVATHSVINYANWRIVSPESSLIDVGTDGYIAQVWTGTARELNFYNGVRKERTFETAFLEYGAMQNLVRASGRRIWFLNDPIEDNPDHDWGDYRANWESTLTASLLQPEISRYEIMPWPERVFNDKHRAETSTSAKTPEQRTIAGGAGSGNAGTTANVEEVGIPAKYETELQSVISALGTMDQKQVRWQEAGTEHVGVLISDTMMFERADPSPSDTALGSFFGLAMPLIKHGLPIEPVQIESAATPHFLDSYKVLLLTYEGQKPPAPQFHDALAAWVRGGGALLVVDNDGDPYNRIREWWNTSPNAYKTPREQLFEKLGLARDASGLFRVGQGVVLSERVSPAALTYKSDGGDDVRGFVRQAAAAVKLPWKETNAMVLRRGPYVIAAGLDESVVSNNPYLLEGRFINLFEADLPLLTRVTLFPNTRALLLDLDALPVDGKPTVIAAACRVRNEEAGADRFTFLADGIADTDAVVRIHTSLKPARVLVGGKPISSSDYEMSQDTLLVRFKNSTSPLPVEVDFAH